MIGFFVLDVIFNLGLINIEFLFINYIVKFKIRFFIRYY